MAEREEIKVDETSDTDLIGQVLHEAFLDDPFIAWLVPVDVVGEQVRQEFWNLVARTRPPRSHVLATGDGSSVALWHKPVLDEGANQQAQADLDKAAEEESTSEFVQFLIQHLGEDATIRLEGFGKVAAAHPAEPHWYLAAVGTRLDWQGRGRGAAIMAPVLEDCDTRGLPAYLESSNPRNLPFYFRQGFEVTEEIVMPGGAASMTGMWRNPR